MKDWLTDKHNRAALLFAALFALLSALSLALALPMGLWWGENFFRREADGRFDAGAAGWVWVQEQGPDQTAFRYDLAAAGSGQALMAVDGGEVTVDYGEGLLWRGQVQNGVLLDQEGIPAGMGVVIVLSGGERENWGPERLSPLCVGPALWIPGAPVGLAAGISCGVGLCRRTAVMVVPRKAGLPGQQMVLPAAPGTLPGRPVRPTGQRPVRHGHERFCAIPRLTGTQRLRRPAAQAAGLPRPGGLRPPGPPRRGSFAPPGPPSRAAQPLLRLGRPAVAGPGRSRGPAPAPGGAPPGPSGKAPPPSGGGAFPPGGLCPPGPPRNGHALACSGLPRLFAAGCSPASPVPQRRFGVPAFSRQGRRPPAAALPRPGGSAPRDPLTR